MSRSQSNSICIVEDGEFESKLCDDECSEIVDPHCTATNPYKVTFQDITAAAFLIKGGIACTPCTVGRLTRKTLILSVQRLNDFLCSPFSEIQIFEQIWNGSLLEERAPSAHWKVGISFLVFCIFEL